LYHKNLFQARPDFPFFSPLQQAVVSPVECCGANSGLFHRQGAKDGNCVLGVLAVKWERLSSTTQEGDDQQANPRKLATLAREIICQMKGDGL
jgi:hypothetical protein